MSEKEMLTGSVSISEEGRLFLEMQYIFLRKICEDIL